MEKDSSQQPQAVFSSNQIGRKGKTNYFTNVKHKRTAKETARQLNPFKGKRKFIAIPILLILIIGIILLLCFIFIWNKPENTELESYTAGGGVEVSSYQQNLSEVYSTAQSKISGDDFSSAMAYVDELIAKSDDFEYRILLIMLKSDLYIYAEKWQNALDVLLGMDPETLSGEPKYDYYLRLNIIYNGMGDADKAAEAEAKAAEYEAFTPMGEYGG